MKIRISFAAVAGLCSIFGFSLAARGGPPAPVCDVTIEVNALRGGSPTTPFGSGATKKITAKARIAKGTGPADQTLENTTLTITAFDRTGRISTAVSPELLTLVVGKGGTGDAVDVPIPQCVGGLITFIARFSGTSSTTGATCDAGRGQLRRTCK